MTYTAAVEQHHAPLDNEVDVIAERPSQDRSKLATFLIDLSPSDMQRRLGDALAVYVNAMRYPRGTEDQRASMWLEHTQRGGWKAVAAIEVPDGADQDGADDPPTSAVELASA